jgi:ABC-type branched-subunit amino acid transport system ATPase component
VEPGDALLCVEGLRVQYGGVVALDDVSLRVPESSIVGLIGPNGAGKTTLVDAITGFCPYRGTVRLDGSVLDGRPPFRRTRAGLARTFQGLELWADLTVEENVGVGHGADRRSTSELDDLFALLDLVGLRGRLAGELSQGERQLVSIARALVGAPKVLLLDEPGAGLDVAESAWLGARIQDIRASGVTILLIDHDMNLVLDVCDQIEVLDFGHVIASGTPQLVRSDRRVMQAYLGGAHGQTEASTG